MSIPLPPLPQRIITMYVEGERGTYPIYKDGYTESQLRARDQEIVRAVLEAALQPFRSTAKYPNGMTKEAAERYIRALEFRHVD